MNKCAKITELSWLVLPKQMSKEEFEELVSDPLPFHRTAFDTNVISVFSFPDKYQLNEKRIFDLDKVRQRTIKTTDECFYRQLKDGVYQRIPNDKQANSSKVIAKYHPIRDFYGKTITAGDILSSEINILGSLDLAFEHACTKEREYVNNFDLFPNQTTNWWHPFSLDTLECPLYIDKSLPLLDGINRPCNYFGKYGTSSPFHIDNYNLSSAIFHIAGFTKVWIVISPTWTTKFEKALEQNVPKDALAKVENNCKRKWTCAKILVTPKTLVEWGIKHFIVCQNPGEYIMLRGGSYHAVFNYGGNVARSVNYNDDRYFEMEIEECQCNPKNQIKAPFNVHIMKQLWHRYQEERIDWATRIGLKFAVKHQTSLPVNDGDILVHPAAVVSGSGNTEPDSTPQAQNIEVQPTRETSSDQRVGKCGSKRNSKNKKRPAKSPLKPDGTVDILNKKPFVAP